MKFLVGFVGFYVIALLIFRSVMKDQIRADENMGNDKKRKAKEKAVSAVTIGSLVILLIIFGANSFYTISEQEAAVVTTFGKPKAVNETGLHFKIPFVQEVTKVNTTINGLTMGYRLDENGNSSDCDEESLMITSDYNFVNVDFYVEYRAIDPEKYLYASEDPVEILRNVCQSWIRDTIGSYNVDDVLTTGKTEIQGQIKERIIEELEEMDIGIQLVNITIQDAEPPTNDVMVAFKAVETAKQGMETSINNANKYMNEQIPLADAEVDRILQEAEVKKTQRINEGNEEVAMFNAMYAEYTKNPGTTKLRMFYEAMEDILPGMKIVINGADGQVQTIYPLDTFSEMNVTEGGADND